MHTAWAASSLNNTWFLFCTKSHIHGSFCHSWVAVRPVALPVIVLVFFAVCSSCSWLLTYSTPFPCLSHTASANPSVMLSREKCPPCGLNRQSLYVHMRRTFVQQIVDHLLPSWYFGNLGKSSIETWLPLKYPKWQSNFPLWLQLGQLELWFLRVWARGGGSTWFRLFVGLDWFVPSLHPLGVWIYHRVVAPLDPSLACNLDVAAVCLPPICAKKSGNESLLQTWPCPW